MLYVSDRLNFMTLYFKRVKRLYPIIFYKKLTAREESLRMEITKSNLVIFSYTFHKFLERLRVTIKVSSKLSLLWMNVTENQSRTKISSVSTQCQFKTSVKFTLISCHRGRLSYANPQTDLVDWYGVAGIAGRSGDRIFVGARFSKPVKTGPEVHATFCTMGNGCLSWRYSDRCLALTTHLHLAPRSTKE